MTQSRSQRIILCPLKIEARTLRKHGIEDTILISGPGADAVEKAVHEASREGLDTHLVLAGLAGGLNPEIRSGEAFCIIRFLDSNGALLNTAKTCRIEKSPSTTIHMAENPIYSPEAKRSLHQTSKAGLVDMEARRFAQVCDSLGMKWSILRGVSDDFSENLPPDSASLVDRNGNSRPTVIAAYVFRHPWRIPALLRLSKRTSKALKNVALELKKLEVVTES